jgi:pilus assembly protein CpaF
VTSEPTAERLLAPDSEPVNRLAGLPLFATVQSAEQPPPRLAAVPSPIAPQHQTPVHETPPHDLAPRPDAAADSAAAGLAHSPVPPLASLARPLEATAAAAGAAPTTLARELPDGAAGLAREPLLAAVGLAHQPQGGLAGPAPLSTPTAVPGLPDHAGARREPPPHAHTGSGVDWAQVRAFRQQAAELLTGQLRDRTGLDEASRREIGRALIVAMLRDHADNLLAEGGSPPSPAQEHALAGAIFDALFGLGRLQPLVDDPAVENVEITGCDQVHLVYGDGRVQPGPPVADSDEELIETLAFLAARSGGRSGSGERAFSPASPILDLTLHGGARLAARAWITPRPTVVIRRHRLTDVDLDDLRRLAMLDDALVAFLSAAVRAGKTIVVSGAQGAGKTTLVRALCNEMDPWERIGTIETEYELHLHELPDRHRRVVAHEARPGTGERTTDGRAAGEITLDDLLYSSLRLNLSRVIVGEVRGREVIPMFKAMQAGAGSLSTTHAHDARAAIERLVTCALEAGPHVTQEYAYLQIASHIDLIVQIGVDDQTSAGGRKHRYVREVIEVARGEGGRPAITDVFGPGPDGRAVPRTRPSFLSDLERAGFDAAWLDSHTGTWHNTDRQTGDQPAVEGRR